MCKLYRICFIGLDFTERIVLSLKVMHDLRVHSAYKKAVLGQFSCYRFIVAAATLHDNASFTIQFSDKFLKRLEISGQAGNIKEF